MGRHLEKCHSDVQQIASLPKPMAKGDPNYEAVNKKRNETLSHLRNLGNFASNIEVLEKGSGTFVVAKRHEVGKYIYSDFKPCPMCYGFYLSTSLYRHAKVCDRSVKEMESYEHEQRAKRQLNSFSQLLLDGAAVMGTKVSAGFREYVLSRLSNDAITLAIKSDPLLLLFGERQFHKLGSQRASEIRGKLRNASRLKLSLRKISNLPNASLQDFLKPDKFDVCYDAVIDLCEVEQEKSLSGTIKLTRPDLALKAGQLLKKLAGVRKGQFIRSKDLEGVQDIDMFLALLKDEWGDRIAAIARQNIQERKYNRKEVLPLTSDIVKLSVSSYRSFL